MISKNRLFFNSMESTICLLIFCESYDCPIAAGKTQSPHCIPLKRRVRRFRQATHVEKAAQRPRITIDANKTVGNRPVSLDVTG